jgi:hypothetical protein
LIFKDKYYIIQALQKLMPFPSNLKCLDQFDINRLVDLLVDHYELSKTSLEIDFDCIYNTRNEIQELYERIFNGIKMEGTVIMYPLYRDLTVEAVMFQASELHSFLLQEHFKLTGRFKLIGVGQDDVLFVFWDQRILVNINHAGPSYISKIDNRLGEDQRPLRPTLLFSKVFLWPDVLEKGTFLLKYDPCYSVDELTKLSLVVDELLEFPPGVKLGQKYPIIAQNVSFDACSKLKKLFTNENIKVIIEDQPEFNNIIYFMMPTDQSDLMTG